ncbi:MAG TPA: zf-HC2 domain-containing protein [Gemmatimonadaceae bacterium]|nr:zf-HC2 domain-containing protein [Gemmatimonadaceae bacterium]
MEASALAVSPCDAIAERIYEFLDGELSAEEDAEVRRHLTACASCARAATRDGAFLRVLEQRVAIDRAPPALRERLIALLAAARATAGAPGEGDEGGAGGAGSGVGGGPRRTPDWPTDPS